MGNLRALVSGCSGHTRQIVIAVNEGETREHLLARAEKIKVQSSCSVLKVEEISEEIPPVSPAKDRFIPAPEKALKCPEDMVLIDKGGKVHPDEPAFCIGKTEVTQAEDRQFWAEKKQAKPQPQGNRAGDKKAATLRTWYDAMAYCAGKYLVGNLPTNRQWEKACGDKHYCTASGDELKPSEADYLRTDEEGPADVDAFPPNVNGVQGMTGGLIEWIREESSKDLGAKFVRGGNWTDGTIGIRRYLLADTLLVSLPDNIKGYVGFRCVASPQESKK